MTDLLPILEAIDRRIDLDQALAERRARRPRLSTERRAVWRKTHSTRFQNDPILKGLGRVGQ